MGEIEEAVDRLADKKRAAGVEVDGQTTGEDGARMVFSGLDFDMAELGEMRAAATAAVLGGMSNNLSDGMRPEEALAHAIAGAWVDGIATGVIMGEARK
jgi:hypothetical protein